VYFVTTKKEGNDTPGDHTTNNKQD